MPRSSSCWGSCATADVAAAPPGACSSAPKARAPSRPRRSTWPRYVPTATPTNGSTSSRWSCCWVCAEMDEALLLGLDVGTSAVKAVLVRPAGAVAGAATASLSLDTPQPGWAEQDPDAWWEASATAIRRVLEQHADVRVAAVGISGQMHSSVFLDKSGAVIRPALLWCDGRTTAECREIVERAGGEAQLREWVCNPALEGFTLPKVLWLRNHEPAAFVRLATVLLAKDFVRLRLTGIISTEPSDASGTLMFDPKRMRWSEEILGAVSLPPTLLPDVGGSADVLGHVTKEAAALTGLAAGTPVVGGGADNACSAAGVGAVIPGEAVSSWGTSGTVLAPTAQPRVDPKLRAHTFCHVAPNVWYVMGVVLSAGGAFAWYRDQCARDLTDPDQRDALLTAEAATVPPGAEGVTFLPYLQGERTPHRDASLRAAFVGLSLAHSRAHLTRAVLEGVCFAMRDCVALLAAVGVGAFPDLKAAVQCTLTRSPLTEPDRDVHGAYQAIYESFRE